MSYVAWNFLIRNYVENITLYSSYRKIVTVDTEHWLITTWQLTSSKYPLDYWHLSFEIMQHLQDSWISTCICKHRILSRVSMNLYNASISIDSLFALFSLTIYFFYELFISLQELDFRKIRIRKVVTSNELLEETRKFNSEK